ncbi:hypothetical protein A2J03_22135 [Rhodococcus sp. EPR-157]|uniref:hypothetical protein n=1 Tax=Rhodococcus sp. EPR-157 TaxID=1813677 RepID=UPI0007BC6E12|nr:hypothetical protein [Rhodococcus sp. EPR-157]KZF07743.1 hypothetical protein A2J03_22135 [Rhodococcus sp. EPR-157]
MRAPNETGDRFAAIAEKIAVLEHALTGLSNDVSAWPDTDHGLRCEPVDGTGESSSGDPDALAATAAAHVQSAREALRRLDGAVSTAWAASARLYLADPAEQR